MNKRNNYLAAAVIGTVAATAAALYAAPSDAAVAATSSVTAQASDTTPASGQTFTVSGGVSSKGAGIPGTITVKTLSDGKWVPLTGATMQTTSAGAYKIRVILAAKGARQLRVVADPDGTTIGGSRTTFGVTVH